MATHIEHLEINTYRGIKDLKIEDLGDVNIIVGDNNTGKTSVLEAIQLLCAPNKYNLMQVARQREKYRLAMGGTFLDSLKYLFEVKDDNHGSYELNVAGRIRGKNGYVRVTGEIETRLADLNFSVVGKNVPETKTGEVDTFCGQIENGFCMGTNGQMHFFPDIEQFEINNYTRLRISQQKDATILQSRAVLTVDHVLENAFSMLIRNKDIKDKVVELLRDQFDSDIVDLRIVSEVSGGRYTPVVEVESGGYIPLSLYGDGMKKALTMLNAIVKTEDGVVLIDEFETALHTSAMEEVFSAVTASARKMGVQLFMTTHSLEAVDKMLESAGEDVSNMRVIRLKKKNGKTYARVMNGQEALENRRNYDLELRV